MAKKKISRKKNPAPSHQKRLDRIKKMFDAQNKKIYAVIKIHGDSGPQYRAEMKKLTRLYEMARKEHLASRTPGSRKYERRWKNPAPSGEKRLSKLSKIYETLRQRRRQVVEKHGAQSPEWYKADRKAVRANTLMLEAAVKEGHRRFLAEKKKKPRKNPATTLPKSPHDPVYTTRVKLRGYTGGVSALSAHGTDGGKVLRKLLPSATVWDHLTLSKKYHVRAQKLARVYDNLLNQAAKETWGRAWRVTDYRVSGIGSNEFSERMKGKLRKAVRESQLYMDAFYAHQVAAKSIRKKD